MVTKNIRKTRGPQAKQVTKPDNTEPFVEGKEFMNKSHEMRAFAERLLGLGILRADVMRRVMARYGVGKNTADGMLKDIKNEWKDWYYADKEERMQALDNMIRQLIAEGYKQNQLGVVAVAIRRLMDLHGVSTETVGNSNVVTNKVTAQLIFGEPLDRTGDEKKDA